MTPQKASLRDLSFQNRALRLDKYKLLIYIFFTKILSVLNLNGGSTMSSQSQTLPVASRATTITIQPMPVVAQPQQTGIIAYANRAKACCFDRLCGRVTTSDAFMATALLAQVMLIADAFFKGATLYYIGGIYLLSALAFGFYNVWQHRDLLPLSDQVALLQNTNRELLATKARLEQIATDLNAENTRLQQTSRELAETNATLRTTSEQLQQTNADLSTTRERLDSGDTTHISSHWYGRSITKKPRSASRIANDHRAIS